MRKIQTCDNSVVCAVSNLNGSTGKIMSKYCIQSMSSSTSKIKEQMWRHFVDSAISIVVKYVVSNILQTFYVLLPVLLVLCVLLCLYVCKHK